MPCQPLALALAGDKGDTVHRPRHLLQRGFTLVELMVTIAVLAVILVVAAPSFRQLLEVQRVRAVAFDMVADLTLARSEALKRGATVTITPTNAGDWTGGWQVAMGTEQIGQKNPVGPGVVFTAAPNSVTFNRNGRISSSNVTVRFGLQTNDSSRQRCILLDPSGRPKSISTACPS